MADAPHDWEFEALGTGWVVSTPEPLPATGAAAVTAELERIDRTWSRFRDDSMVADMARGPGRFPIPVGDQPLIDWYERLYRVTGGAVSPLVGQALVNAGYDAQYTLRRIGGISPCPAWNDVIATHDGDLVTTTATVFDVGAAGKGFAIDRVAEIVAGYTDSFIVDGSGDMVISTGDPVRVALEHPGDPSKAIGVATLGSGAICASARNRRAWGEHGDWHHIIDPTTGTPTWDVVATWVIAPTAMLADGLSTALFFTPPERLREQSAQLGTDFDYVVVRHNGTVDYSDNPDWELFL
ncbi:FAD:protein FMN transferase [Gordonia amarae]|nr:FAD:protein FMN transferase [Gordonia amarae]MCS3877859.1 thiamine biosynthesis lipoprotein [Gordonia amarae]QHN29960.1 FAD:protein FMN transferase [Gordonia amarae]QHN38735.1 FAD:protein FMN transferase [Gordonia amarae]